MNSSSLEQNGFNEFIPLKMLSYSVLPSDQATLVLIDSTLTGKPTSDILYIGKSKKLSKRVFGGYLSGYGGKTTRRINSMLFNDGYLEKVAISWMASDDPKAAQAQLLEQFKKEHGEYPAWNVTKKSLSIPKPKPKAAPKPTKPRSRPK